MNKKNIKITAHILECFAVGMFAQGVYYGSLSIGDTGENGRTYLGIGFISLTCAGITYIVGKVLELIFGKKTRRFPKRQGHSETALFPEQ
jgi:hypothetical protein